jgi:hypothetical protein
VSIGFLLPDSSALKDIDNQDDNSQNQKDMNEPSHGITAYKSEQPEDRKYYKDCPQHDILLLILMYS